MQLTLRQPDYGHTTNTGASRRPEAQSSTLRQSVRREHTPAKAHAHVHVTRSSQPEHGARRHRNPGHRLAAAAAANSPSAGGATPCATLCTGPDSTSLGRSTARRSPSVATTEQDRRPTCLPKGQRSAASAGQPQPARKPTPAGSCPNRHHSAVITVPSQLLTSDRARLASPADPIRRAHRGQIGGRPRAVRRRPLTLLRASRPRSFAWWEGCVMRAEDQP